MSADLREFWMVYGLGQQVPKAFHYSERDAAAEARRLAERHGGTFVVLHSVSAYKRTEPVQEVAIGPYASDPDELPF